MILLALLCTLLSFAARPGEDDARAILGLPPLGEDLVVQVGPAPGPSLDDADADPQALGGAALVDLVQMMARAGASDDPCGHGSCPVQLLRVFGHAHAAHGNYADACVFFAAIAGREPQAPERLLVEGCLAERFADTPRAQLHLEHARCLVETDNAWMRARTRPGLARAEVARWYARAAARAHLDALGGVETGPRSQRARGHYDMALRIGPSGALEPHIRAARRTLPGPVVEPRRCGVMEWSEDDALEHVLEARR